MVDFQQFLTNWLVSVWILRQELLVYARSSFLATVCWKAILTEILPSPNHKIVSDWTVLWLVKIFLESQYFHWNSFLTEHCAKVESFTSYYRVRNKHIWKMIGIHWELAVLKNSIFFESAILIFFSKKEYIFCFIPMKISPNLYGRMDKSKFWCFLWFPENSSLCVILCYTV